jgi:hypothetical protein
MGLLGDQALARRQGVQQRDDHADVGNVAQRQSTAIRQSRASAKRRISGSHIRAVEDKLGQT